MFVFVSIFAFTELEHFASFMILSRLNLIILILVCALCYA